MDSRNRPAYMRWWRAQQKTITPKPVPDLPWPKNAFGHDLRIDELMAQDSPYFLQGPKGKLREDERCGNPRCTNRHNNHVSWTRRSPFGEGWDITWFCGNSCKTAFIRGGVR